ncbi:major facilitator super transporter protein [Didymella pomorum]|uniref:GPI ethanolamine phosphate transferase 2 n=1 Tax=Didymella pomorum TaxID=749634 RepID=A0A9W9D5F2_9PLEO|nr:major facilitator super transporter protein [Didymella pomorum]
MAPRKAMLALANLLIPVAILVFATGFFPYKPFMPGLADYEDVTWIYQQGDGTGGLQAPEAPFDKLVFMVVDALRSDFVYGEESGMSFVQSLIRDGTALPFTAHATSPTITMPRVKAITTGSIPSFLDVILNFAESDTTSTLATQDTWLAQIKTKRFGDKQGKLVMYGDDTWLKLFPDFFERADGTSSFFVSVSLLYKNACRWNTMLMISVQDFTEVDNNVTRHVPNELLNDDWNAMIMHYLGLDHIGHKAGPKSPNMIPKQKEMDDIVRATYTAIENEDHLSNTLFVLCGDHGMNEGGNHGGSSPGETSPALVFMSPKLTKITQNQARTTSPARPKTEGEFDYYRTIEQSDIAPTLAGLLGFPVPQNNLGVFLSEFLGFWDNGIYYSLTLTLYTVLMFASSYVEEEHNFWYWITSGWFFYLYLGSLRQDKSNTWLLHPALLALAIHRLVRRWNQTGQKFAGADDIVNSGIFHGNNSILLWVLVGATYLDVTNRISRHIARSVVTLDTPASTSQLDSEPEQQHRMMGSLIATPLCVAAIVFKLAFTAKDAPELTYGLSEGIMERVEMLNLVDLARMVFGGIALVFSWIMFSEWQRSKRRTKLHIRGNGDLATAFLDMLTLFLLTQTKAHNIPLYLLFRIQFFLLSLLPLTHSQTTLTTLLLSQTSFFALGLNNSISSIDLSNAYNGVSGYNILAVGLLVFLSNWAGSVYWGVAGLCLLGQYGSTATSTHLAKSDARPKRSWVEAEHAHLHDLAIPKVQVEDKKQEKDVWTTHIALLTLFTGVMLASVMAACTALRTHLFIWTVFSPKYLFAMAWGVAWHLGITIGLGGLVKWMGTW